MATASQSQPNGIPSSSAASQSQPPQTQTPVATIPASQPAAGPVASGPLSPTTHAPKPRDSRTIELLLTSQGVTSFDNRVPLLLLDFAYRHTSSILSDALHLTTDPYTSHAGAKPSAASGAAPTAPSATDAQVSTNAVNLAIASRQAYQFRGGSGAGGSGGGGASKEWLQELAKERNKVALPRVSANAWGVRLPGERFVLDGTGWGIQPNGWAEDGYEGSEDEEEEQMEDVMDGLEGAGAKKEPKDGESGGLDQFIDEDMDEDEEMAEQ